MLRERCLMIPVMMVAGASVIRSLQMLMVNMPRDSARPTLGVGKR